MPYTIINHNRFSRLTHQTVDYMQTQFLNCERVRYVETLPDNANEGDLAYNTSDHIFYGYNGNEWKQMIVGELPFSDIEPLLKSAEDTTKSGRFDLSGISSSNLRTLSFPDKDGVIATIADLPTVNRGFAPNEDATYDLGNSSHRYKDAYLSGNLTVGTVDGVDVSTHKHTGSDGTLRIETVDLGITGSSNGNMVRVVNGRLAFVDPVTITGLSGSSGPSGYSGLSGWSGFSGAKGDSGDYGPIGPSGYSGMSGWSGISGYSGRSGISGHSGISGASGYSGLSGYSGHSGKSGYSGFSGYSGISGLSGISGYSGYSGISGWSGANGEAGAKGDTGSQGESGQSGYSGYSGWSGHSGQSGMQGVSGFSGRSGWSGKSGYSGATGTSGHSGYSGFSGYSGMGYSGYSGYSGASGHSGISGPRGATGAQGSQGDQGQQGISGWSGYSGWSGQIGATGLSGPQGVQGSQGAQGTSGYSGWSGYSGLQGTNGVSGFSGYSGYSGLSGYSGANGTGGGKSAARYIIQNESGTYKCYDGNSGSLVTSNTSAVTVINYALSNLTAGRTWKEKVYLKGNITITGPINMVDNSILELEGKVTLSNGANSFMVTATSKNSFEIRGGEWVGNSVNQTPEYLSDTDLFEFYLCTDVVIRDLKIHDCKYQNIVFITCTDIEVYNIESYDSGWDNLTVAYTGYCMIHNNYIHDSLQGGCYCYCEDDSTAQKVSNIQLIGNRVERTLTSGLSISLRGSEDTGVYNLLSNNIIIDAGMDGQHPGMNLGFGSDKLARYCMMTGNIIYQTGDFTCGEGLDVAGEHCIIANNIIHHVNDGAMFIVHGGHNTICNNQIYDVQGDTSSGIYIIGSSYNKVMGNTIRNIPVNGIHVQWDESSVYSTYNQFTNNYINTCGTWFIRIADANDVGNQIEDNFVVGSSTISSVGTSTIRRNNRGYATESRGTATISSGSSTVTVAHGLALAPTKVIVTGTTSGTGNAWVTNLTTSNFTINVSSAVGSNTTVYWMAEV